MELVFMYGPPASGKLTVGRRLAELTGYALFHNHLVVDAVGAVFPFGSESFVRLRQEFWLRTFDEATRAGASLIFTFAPEPTVTPAFPDQVRDIVGQAGGSVRFFALTIQRDEQERRLAAPSREAFGKLTSLELFRSLRSDFDRCCAAMPGAELVVDTTSTPPDETARQILRRLQT